MFRKCWPIVACALLIILAGCGPAQGGQTGQSQPLNSDAVNLDQHPTPTPTISIPSQKTLPTHTPGNNGARQGTAGNMPPAGGSSAAPYGPPPSMSGEEQQLTQQLFALINSDRAARGLYAYSWNATLAAGARLHSWNMFHCGFSHTCPDGMTQYQRIANEGFAGQSDCGENIGEAGPYPTPWAGVYKIQESMAHEPLGGWHRIHLFSTTLHRIGIGVYVDPSGMIWFTEDMAS